MNAAADQASRPREIWTRLTVDPLADPLARFLAGRRSVTPDHITAVAVLLAVASSVCFATGYLRIGGALFLGRFFADCLDGKVARLRGSSSARGAMFDLAADVGGICLVSASLSWWLLESRATAPLVPLAFIAGLAYYNWALAYRKQLGHQLGVGDGGADHERHVQLPLIGAWVAFCRRINMSPVPWALEAEIVVLGLTPLLAPAAGGTALAAGAGFYLVANVVNTRRMLRLSRLLDVQRQRRTDS